MTRNLNLIRGFLLLGGFLSLGAATTLGQTPDASDAPQPQEQSQPQPRPRDESRSKPVFGKVASVQNGRIVLTKPDGGTVTVRVSGDTEFRRGRQNAKLGDIKVGDAIMVRGDANADHSISAHMVAFRSGDAIGGPGDFIDAPAGTLGKDFVVGEIKQLSLPRLTVLRVDNVEQIIEVNEGTSLRKGRESITLPDVHVGDHVMVRGALRGDAFVPKSLVVVSPEQWQRMKEMGDGSASKAPKPPESHD